MRNVHDLIYKHCNKSTWADFKSIFNRNGSSSKIYWEGDASMLNYIFRKLHKELNFSGKKWEVVSYYFKRVDKNDDTLETDKLINNGHFDEDKNNPLKTHLETLIVTLNQ